MIRYYYELTRKEMEAVDKKNTVVLFPLGAIEQHGSQAPLGTDTIIAEAMRGYIKEELEKVDPDYEMLMLPPMPVGFSVEHLDFCGSLSFKADTYYHLLYDICSSLAYHGFKKIAFLLCHGGNKPVVDSLARQLRRDLNIYPFVLNNGAFSHPDVKATITPGNERDFHGAEMETSMVMAIKPDTVKLEYSEAGYLGEYDGKKAVKFSGSKSIPWMGRDFVTAEGKPIGILGDPAGATAEKGEIILRTTAKTLVPAFLEIRDWKIE